MNILAFDTCFDGCSVCVAERRGDAVVPLSFLMERFETGHAERLIPMIGEAMQQARLNFDHLDRIAVTVGPGTFTGTRIGVAAARAFALATGAQTVGVSSLAVMAEVARRKSRQPRRWPSSSMRGAAKSTRSCSVPAAGSMPSRRRSSCRSRTRRSWAARPMVFVGSGGAAVADAVRARAAMRWPRLPDLLPDASRWRSIAAALEASEAPARPLYLRPPDAKPQDGKAIARA